MKEGQAGTGTSFGVSGLPVRDEDEGKRLQNVGQEERSRERVRLRRTDALRPVLKQITWKKEPNLWDIFNFQRAFQSENKQWFWDFRHSV